MQGIASRNAEALFALSVSDYMIPGFVCLVSPQPMDSLLKADYSKLTTASPEGHAWAPSQLQRLPFGGVRNKKNKPLKRP